MEELAEQEEPVDEAVALEEAMHLAIAACDGDLHATIRALLVSNSYLHAEVQRLRDLISQGFVRGRHRLSDLS